MISVIPTNENLISGTVTDGLRNDIFKIDGSQDAEFLFDVPSKNFRVLVRGENLVGSGGIMSVFKDNQKDGGYSPEVENDGTTPLAFSVDNTVNGFENARSMGGFYKMIFSHGTISSGIYYVTVGS